MKYLYIFLLFCICAKSQQPLNIVSYVGCGFDAKKGTYGLAPIFEYTYEQNNQWKSPSGNIYLYPDQMIVSPYDEVQEIVFQGNYSTYNEYLESYTSWFTFSVSDVNVQYDFSFAAKYSKELGYIDQTLNENYESILHGLHWWNYYAATLYPPYILTYDYMFNKSIEYLPRTIQTQSDSEKYYEFVQSFGTHVMIKTVGGAKVTYNAGITKSLSEQYQESWQEEQFSFSFHYNLFGISSGGFANKNDITINQAFLVNSNMNATFIGGNPIYANLNNLTQWADSIEANTAPLNSSLVGLWHLIDDPVKSQTLYSFITSYLSDGANTKFSDKKDYPGNGCIGSGFDIVTLSSCLAPLFVFTYNNSNSYPDQVFSQYTPETQIINITVTMTDTFSGTAWSEYFYESSYGFMGMGTKTKEIYEFYSNYYTNQKSLSSNWITIAYETLTMPILPMPIINPLFIKAVDMLPVYNGSNPYTKNMYFEFFQTFGTAFADQIVLGGKYQFDLWYDTMFIQSQSYTEISEEAHESYLGIIGDGHGHSYEIKNVNKEFVGSIEYYYLYEGGNIDYQVNEWDEWLQTIKGNESVVQYHLQPITLLINDQNKVTSIMAAFKDYAFDAINELNQYIKSLQ